MRAGEAGARTGRALAKAGAAEMEPAEMEAAEMEAADDLTGPTRTVAPGERVGSLGIVASARSPRFATQAEKAS